MTKYTYSANAYPHRYKTLHKSVCRLSIKVYLRTNNDLWPSHKTRCKAIFECQYGWKLKLCRKWRWSKLRLTTIIEYNINLGKHNYYTVNCTRLWAQQSKLWLFTQSLLIYSIGLWALNVTTDSSNNKLIIHNSIIVFFNKQS